MNEFESLYMEHYFCLWLMLFMKWYKVITNFEPCWNQNVWLVTRSFCGRMLQSFLHLLQVTKSCHAQSLFRSYVIFGIFQIENKHFFFSVLIISMQHVIERDMNRLWPWSKLSWPGGLGSKVKKNLSNTFRYLSSPFQSQPLSFHRQ